VASDTNDSFAERYGLLRVSGFKTVDFYGSYDFANYEKSSSDHLIIVAHK
jgi:hypothetical protein